MQYVGLFPIICGSVLTDHVNLYVDFKLINKLLLEAINDSWDQITVISNLVEAKLNFLSIGVECSSEQQGRL